MLGLKLIIVANLITCHEQLRAFSSFTKACLCWSTWLFTALLECFKGYYEYLVIKACIQIFVLREKNTYLNSHMNVAKLWSPV